MAKSKAPPSKSKSKRLKSKPSMTMGRLPDGSGMMKATIKTPKGC